MVSKAKGVLLSRYKNTLFYKLKFEITSLKYGTVKSLKLRQMEDKSGNNYIMKLELLFYKRY